MIHVLMFHSIGLEKSDWSRRMLSVPLDHFIYFCDHIVSKGYETIFLDQWQHEVTNSTHDNNKYIVLTFDDGYLDNWVYLYPLLKKYNLKATIFINPEFVDPREKPRYTLEDVSAGKVNSTELKNKGFMSWNEMRIMEKSGLVDIQSHSMTHNRYFCDREIIDIFTGEEFSYDWLPWIKYKDEKPFYMSRNLLKNIPIGTPIFKNDRSLKIKRYFPPDEVIEYAQCETNKMLRNNNGLTRNGRLQLVERLKSFNYNSDGVYESDSQQLKRYEYELCESKSVIEQMLSKKVDFLCWPGGGYNKRSIELSIKAGYKASTVKPSDYSITAYGTQEYKRIRRIGMSSNINSSERLILKPYKNALVECMREQSGGTILKNILRIKRHSLYYFLKFFT
jgi:peptidoglycan/xylan/chitin deacetylase (PgdA/CDA1 family)